VVMMRRWWCSSRSLKSTCLPSTAILFALVRQSCPELMGECDVWLGDVPEVPSLAFLRE
jgi:hypothetical protein